MSIESDIRRVHRELSIIDMKLQRTNCRIDKLWAIWVATVTNGVLMFAFAKGFKWI